MTGEKVGDQVGMAGLTLHDTDVVGLEALRRALAEAPATFPRDLADELAASEVVLLATCNRVEIAYARESGPPPGPRDRAAILRTLGLAGASAERLWIRTGREAAHHVLRVASSLDSLVVGEAQILAQVRAAFERAQALGLVGERLTPIFDAAIRVGKQVRTETELARHPVSVVSLGVQHIATRCAALERRPRVALVGAGRMGRLAARSVLDAGLELVAIANRTRAAAEVLACETGARALALEALAGAGLALDGLISATGAPGYVLDAEALRRLAGHTPGGRPLVAVDLALPRDLEPSGHARVELVDLDALRARADENRNRRREAAARAEELVQAKLERLTTGRVDGHVASVVAETLAESNELFEHELVRLFQGRLAHLSETDRRSVERWARCTFGRLAHAPVRAFKELACEERGATGGGLEA